MNRENHFSLASHGQGDSEITSPWEAARTSRPSPLPYQPSTLFNPPPQDLQHRRTRGDAPGRAVVSIYFSLSPPLRISDEETARWPRSGGPRA